MEYVCLSCGKVSGEICSPCPKCGGSAWSQTDQRPESFLGAAYASDQNAHIGSFGVEVTGGTIEPLTNGERKPDTD